MRQNRKGQTFLCNLGAWRGRLAGRPEPGGVVGWGQKQAEQGAHPLSPRLLLLPLLLLCPRALASENIAGLACNSCEHLYLPPLLLSLCLQPWALPTWLAPPSTATTPRAPSRARR